MGAYGASKAALEESVRTWSIEQPLVRFSTIAVGGCFPTEFGDSFDPGHLTDALNDWTRHGLMTEQMLDPEDVAGTLVGILGTALDYPGVGLEHMVDSGELSRGGRLSDTHVRAVATLHFDSTPSAI